MLINFKSWIYSKIKNIPHLPFYAVLTLDVLMVLFVFGLTFFIFKSFSPGLYAFDQLSHWLSIAFFVILFFMSFKVTYRSVIRFTSLYEIYSLFFVFAFSFLVLIGLNFLNQWVLLTEELPKLFMFLALSGSFFFVVFYRILVKEVFHKVSKSQKNEKNIILFGAGEFGPVVYELLKKDSKNNLRVAAFFDDDKSKYRKRLYGIDILHGDLLLEEWIEKEEIHEVIVTDPNLSSDRKSQLFSICTSLNVSLKFLPNLDFLVTEELKISDLREINLEELLGRDPINLDKKHLNQFFETKNVLVSGAAGSIGSEIVRQMARLPIRKLILLDYAESPLYDIQQEIIAKHPDLNLEVVLLDIRKRELVLESFIRHKPDIVFHAAAYKHVPLMESFPQEAIKTNIFGTVNLADAAEKVGVSKFVFVSTDKAVNPTNVMGASKRISEKYVQSKYFFEKNTGPTQFITTRFGNVLGSNGSVIPLFLKQIKEGGPLTVTDKNIERYFMTIPEACSLVLEASCMGNGGEIFVFDMGKPVKIYDLAENLIKLNGKVPHKDIEIKISGLRPGEKLFEELVGNQEYFKNTHHHKIFIVQSAINDFLEIKESVQRLRDLVKERKSREEVIHFLKGILPEYNANESNYSLIEN